jgi:hypothetical protein
MFVVIWRLFGGYLAAIQQPRAYLGANGVLFEYRHQRSQIAGPVVSTQIFGVLRVEHCSTSDKARN